MGNLKTHGSPADQLSFTVTKWDAKRLLTDRRSGIMVDNSVLILVEVSDSSTTLSHLGPYVHPLSVWGLELRKSAADPVHGSHLTEWHVGVALADLDNGGITDVLRSKKQVLRRLWLMLLRTCTVNQVCD